MDKGFTYYFHRRGIEMSVDAEYVALYYPSISGDGSGFFTLVNGERFRGENVREVKKGKAELCRYL
jgi:hypothetical protein